MVKSRVPPGENDHAHPPRRSHQTGTGGTPLRIAAGLIIAPAVLALVVLGGSILATGRAQPETVVAGIALALVVISAGLGTRALLNSLTRLRNSALTAANRVLPERLERLREPRGLGDRTPEEFVRDAADPVAVPTHDELGQVAYAVNTMYREALFSAAEQAVLRGEVNAMVFSLARRSQTLVDKMAATLREIERAETDPERLTRLFELDRLAARMRRNDENMLILAGVDSATPPDHYLLLTELVEAARAEVEHHGRIDHGTVDDDVAVTAHAAGDVVRLIAELIDNATRFSPPSAAVLVDGRRIGDYVLIEIEDRGLGMSQAQLDGYNHRLANPPAADVSDCRMMGLAVVGRIAERHQIRVTLRANSDTGTVVSVTLPTPLLVLPNRRFDRALPRAPRAPELPAAPPGWPLATGPSAGPAVGALPARSGDQSMFSGGPGALPGRTGQGVLGSGLGALPPRTHALPAGSSPAGVPGQPAHASTAEQTAQPGRGRSLPRHSESGQVLALPSGTPASAGSAPPPGSARAAGFAGTGFAGTGPISDGPGVGAGPGSGIEAPVVGDGDEPVIFREMQARWFGGPGGSPTTRSAGAATSPIGAATPPAGAAGPAAGADQSPATGRPANATPQVATPAGVGTAGGGHPTGAPAAKEAVEFLDDEYGWRSAGDEGWRAASAAAEPVVLGTTKSGLPRRIPAAQLVPGGVARFATESAARRDPDEVRGMLAAYHRGVQRGRGGGEAQSSGHPRSADEEIH